MTIGTIPSTLSKLLISAVVAVALTACGGGGGGSSGSPTPSSNNGSSQAVTSSSVVSLSKSSILSSLSSSSFSNSSTSSSSLSSSLSSSSHSSSIISSSSSSRTSSSQISEQKLVLLGGAIQGANLNLSGVVSTLAGSGPDTEGLGSAARFNSPESMVRDGANLYVVDTYNHSIRKIVIATGAVSTLAGGTEGAADGIGAAARFYYPQGIASDGTNLYVSDTGNHCIRKVVKATGVVTTLVGAPDVIGSSDGLGANASFDSPVGIVVLGENLYVVDRGNNNIRKIVIATGAVTTLAGGGGEFNDRDGIGTEAVFYMPTGITALGGDLYVADTLHSSIRKIIIATGEVTTLPVLSGADPLGVDAGFYYPRGITTDGIDLFVADTRNNSIRKLVVATGELSTIAGATEAVGSADGVGALARFDSPVGIASDGNYLYVADTGNRIIRKIAIASRSVTTLAGKLPHVDGVGSAATFNDSNGVTTDGTNLYIADTANHSIRKIVIASGEVTTLAGGIDGDADGVGSAARFSVPMGITTDGTNLYVTDRDNHKIRKIVIATGEVTTFAGSGFMGFSNGTGTSAVFDFPVGITTDGVNLYVVDSGNSYIRKVVIATAEVTTFTVKGFWNAYTESDRFFWPTGITTDGTNLYVLDGNSFNISLIFKITLASGEATLLAGGNSGNTDGLGSVARFGSPQWMTTDGKNLYVADRDNHSIRKIELVSNTVSTLAGGKSGNADGVGASAGFNHPQGITTDGHSLFVVDAQNNTVRKID